MFLESRLARSLDFEPDSALSAKQRDPFRAWIVPIISRVIPEI
jgi:hypothetical protein